MDLCSVIQLKPGFPAEDDIVVHRVRGVHSRMIEFQHFGHSRQFLAQFGECRPYIHSGYTPLCMRRNREEAEAESLPRRKVLARRQALNAAG
ncbi:MAG: hypothetical protein LC126_04010 [Bryobacterales bacterium]|nr:hypothetical protein [Bryobacterales bacterium]